MARREKQMDKDEKESWGTLEELLLACAVNRHGAKSWDSIAAELQRRTSRHHLRAFYSPPNCKRKYQELRRRFTGGGDDEERLRAMVDELKRLRVAELRREVERRDISIEFLQLKVRRLEEEREQSFKRKEQVKEEETDLQNELDRRNHPQKIAERLVSGDGSDNRSFNESNSTSNQKGNNNTNRAESIGKPDLNREPDEPENIECKPEMHEPDPVQTGSKPVLGTELCDSVAESTRQVRREGTKQSIEVLSSKQKKKRRRNRFPIASSSGDDDEPEPAVKSEPLIKIIAMVRSHKNGSLFERRLRSQETERYKKMIRQHIDLQTVQRRVDRGFYKGSTNKLFRDLLLLFNNAVVFFRNSSLEHNAALQLRQLVTDQIIAARPKSMPPKSHPDRIRPGPRPDKAPAPPPPIAVCRRRMEKKEQQQQQHSRLRSSNGDDNNKVVMEKKCVNKKQLGVKEKVDLSRRSGSGTSSKKDRNVITIHSGANKKVRNVIKNHSEDDDDDDVDDVDDELEIRLRKRKNESLKKKKKNIGTGSGYLKRMTNKSPPKEVEEDSTDDGGGDETSEEEENGREKRRRRKGGNGGSKRGRPPKRSPGRTDSAGKFGKRRREGRDPPPAAAELGRARKRPRR